MRRSLLPAGISALLLMTGAAYTADQRPGTPAEHGNAANQEYMASMQDMNQAMMRANDPDISRAFALKMIAHHKGAIAMSNILLKHGGDPELRPMAEKMIRDQTKEIGELQSWLDRHGGRGGKS
jgi:uncharacterized protein (DUF305 family)